MVLEDWVWTVLDGPADCIHPESGVLLTPDLGPKGQTLVLAGCSETINYL